MNPLLLQRKDERRFWELLLGTEEESCLLEIVAPIAPCPK
jgi:hypothetical protein